jgi:hypothetical protein
MPPADAGRPVVSGSSADAVIVETVAPGPTVELRGPKRPVRAESASPTVDRVTSTKAVSAAGALAPGAGGINAPQCGQLAANGGVSALQLGQFI